MNQDQREWKNARRLQRESSKSFWALKCERRVKYNQLTKELKEEHDQKVMAFNRRFNERITQVGMNAMIAALRRSYRDGFFHLNLSNLWLPVSNRWLPVTNYDRAHEVGRYSPRAALEYLLRSAEENNGIFYTDAENGYSMHNIVQHSSLEQPPGSAIIINPKSFVHKHQSTEEKNRFLSLKKGEQRPYWLIEVSDKKYEFSFMIDGQPLTAEIRKEDGTYIVYSTDALESGKTIHLPLYIEKKPEDSFEMLTFYLSSTLCSLLGDDVVPCLFESFDNPHPTKRTTLDQLFERYKGAVESVVARQSYLNGH